MTIKQLGGVFGRNPEFNEVDVKKISIESSVQPSLEINNTGSDGDILSIEKNGSAVGSLGNFSTRLYIESDGDASGLLFGSGDVSPRKNGANVSDAVSLGNTTNKFKFLYLTRNVVVGNGYGIDFSATSGTGTSELLDDYEEGAWTSVVEGSTSAGTATYILQLGTYTKIGNVCSIRLQLVFNSHTGTGDFVISGLPFNVADGGGVGAMAWYGSAFTYTGIPSSRFIFGGDTIKLYDLTSGAGSLAALPIKTSASLYLSGVYRC